MYYNNYYYNSIHTENIFSIVCHCSCDITKNYVIINFKFNFIEYINRIYIVQQKLFKMRNRIIGKNINYKKMTIVAYLNNINSFYKILIRGNLTKLIIFQFIFIYLHI